MTLAPTPVRRHLSPLVPAFVVAAVALGLGLALLVRHDGTQSSSLQGTIGSGVSAVEVRHVPSFTGIDLAGSNVVDIRVGSRQSVLVRADDNLLRHVTTHVDAGTLAIGSTGSFSARAPMSVEITVPSLTRLALSGSGKLTAVGVATQHLTVRLSGSGVVHATGAVTRLDVVLDGSGDIQLEHVVARDVKAVLNASGRIGVQATENLDASIVGSGTIVYAGKPGHVARSISGSGTITGE